jgi:hypothetical protein
MKRIYIGLLLLVPGAYLQAEPGRLLSQETAAVAASEVSLDLDYNGAPQSVGLAAGLRIGAFGGEVLVNAKPPTTLDGSGFVSSNIGYKRVLMPRVAAYGIVAYENPDNAPSTSDVAIGAAYTLTYRDVLLNVNAEVVTDADGNNNRGDRTTLFVKGGAGYPIATGAGRVTLIMEMVAESNSALDPVLNLGARWQPRRNVTLDFVVLNERGDNGAHSGLPGAVRLNIGF